MKKKRVELRDVVVTKYDSGKEKTIEKGLS